MSSATPTLTLAEAATATDPIMLETPKRMLQLPKSNNKKVAAAKDSVSPDRTLSTVYSWDNSVCDDYDDDHNNHKSYGDGSCSSYSCSSSPLLNEEEYNDESSSYYEDSQLFSPYSMRHENHFRSVAVNNNAMASPRKWKDAMMCGCMGVTDSLQEEEDCERSISLAHSTLASLYEGEDREDESSYYDASSMSSSSNILNAITGVDDGNVFGRDN